MDVVFHCATAAPTGAGALNKALMDGVNVTGTRNIVAACQACKVKKLVSTSSASVVFDGRTLSMVDESHPYALKPMDYYTRTKIEGEKLVLAANGVAGVATCALRPSGIFGEGDPLFVPTVAKQAERGKTKYIIGDGSNRMDFTYVGNVAQVCQTGGAVVASAHAKCSFSMASLLKWPTGSNSLCSRPPGSHRGRGCALSRLACGRPCLFHHQPRSPPVLDHDGSCV